MRNKRELALVSLVLVFAASFAAAQTVTYKYDDLGRVVSATQAGMSTSYGYDNADNRVAVATTTSGMSAPLTCPSFSMTVNPQSNDPVSVGVPLGSGCSDSGGYSIATNPAAPYNITVAVHTTTPVTYTASDGHGGTASATITVIRP